MKQPAKMSGVELLAEFCRNQEYMRHVFLARRLNSETFEHRRPDGSVAPRRPSWILRRPGQVAIEVGHPSPAQDVRWAALCNEINARIGPVK